MTIDPLQPAPSAQGTLGDAGKQPLSKLLDVNGDGIPDYEQKWFRDAVASGAFQLIGFLFPKSPWALVLKQYEPEIEALIEKGSV